MRRTTRLEGGSPFVADDRLAASARTAVAGEPSVDDYYLPAVVSFLRRGVIWYQTAHETKSNHISDGPHAKEGPSENRLATMVGACFGTSAPLPTERSKMPPTNWTHGSAVGVEYPGRVYDGGPNTPRNHPRRAGWGTDVRQRSNTFNWFHFAIPTETARPGEPYHTDRLRVPFWLNGWSRLDAVHVWLGGDQIFREDDISWGGPHERPLSLSFNRQLPRHRIGNRAINVSVRITFPSGVDEMGMVRFHGASASLDD